MPISFTLSPHRGVKSAIYIVAVGDLFYIGSSKRVGHRLKEHRSLLRRGKHWCRRLQDAFDAGGEFSNGVVEEASSDLSREALYAIEQVWLDEHFDDPNCVNQSREAATNSLFASNTYRMMQDPVMWAKQLEHLDRIRPPITFESRLETARQSILRGVQTPCLVRYPSGAEELFSSRQAAAGRLGVETVSLTKWMSGRQPWPGTGKYRTRKHLSSIDGVRVVAVPAPTENFLGDFLGRCVDLNALKK